MENSVIFFLHRNFTCIVIIVCVSQGALFFDALLQKLQTVYQFKLEDYMDGMAIRARPLRKTVHAFELLSVFVCLCVHLKFRDLSNNLCV